MSTSDNSYLKAVLGSIQSFSMKSPNLAKDIDI